ncbi:MAG TPA: ABC transporter permease, partial [Acidimicrobiales bacterium]
VTFVFGALVAPSGEPIDALVFSGTHRAIGARVVAGREPDPGQVGELVMTRHVGAPGFDVGTRFDLVTLTQEQAEEGGYEGFVQGPKGPTVDAVLVGIIDGPAELNDPEFAALVIAPPALLDLDVGGAITVMSVRLRPGTDLGALRTQLDQLPDGETLRLQPAELIAAEVRKAVQGQASGLWVLTAVAAVAAVVVLGQLIMREIRLTADEGPCLEAIGFRRAQLRAERLGRAAVPIVTGTCLGAALATGLSPLFPTGFVRRIEPDPGVRIDVAVMALGAAMLLVALLAWVLAALLLARPAQRGGRPSTLVESVASRFRSASLSTGFRFAFTRGQRDRGSVRGSVTGMVVTAALLMGAVVFGSSLGRLVSDGSRFGNNFTLIYGSGGERVPDEVRSALEADDDVAGLMLYATTHGRVGGRSLGLAGMEPVRGDLAPKLLTGRMPAADDEIALGRLAAHDLGVEVGEDVTIEGEGGTGRFRVTGLAVVPGIEGLNGVGQDAVVTIGGLARLDPAVVPNAAAVTLRPGTDPGRFAELGLGGGNSVPSEILQLSRLRSMPFVLAWLLAALAVLTTVHVMVTSVRNRRRDVAVLRSLGADGPWITRTVHSQATLFSLLPLVVGVPLGLSVGRIVFEAFAGSVGAVPDASFPYALLAAVTAGILLLANAAAVVPARRARRLAPAPLLAAE